MISEEAAKELALGLHARQMYGEHPYSYHLESVVELLPQELKALGWLHDALEDTPITAVDLVEDHNVSGRQVSILNALTHPSGESLNDYRERIKISGIPTVLIKSADSRSNLHNCVINPHQDPNVQARRLKKYETNARVFAQWAGIPVDVVQGVELFDEIIFRLTRLYDWNFKNHV